jgi:RDD family
VAGLLSMHSEAARPALDRQIGPARFTAPVQALMARMMAPAAADRFVSYDALIAELDRVSVRRTRPAGFLVRLAAAGLDFAWLLALLVVPMALLDADGGSLFTVALMALFACFKVLITHRIGGTLGQRIFELEVIDVTTHRRPTLVKLVQRTALLMAPIAIAGATNLFGYLPLSAPVLGVLDSISEGMKAVAVVGIVLALAVSSLRAAGRRTPWDRWSGTMVQYRKG